jgi:hypothetical protein
LSISPTATAVNPGDQFTLDVVVTTDIVTRGLQFGLSFDPSLVQVNSVDEGTFYKSWADSNGETSIADPPWTVDNTSGTVSIGSVALLAPPSSDPGAVDTNGPSGSGTAATITLTAAQGVNNVATLTLSSVVINGVQNGLYLAIPSPTVTNGQVTIGEVTLTPTPTVTETFLPGTGTPTETATFLPGTGTPTVTATFLPGTGTPTVTATFLPGTGTPTPTVTQTFLPGTGTPTVTGTTHPGTGTPSPGAGSPGASVSGTPPSGTALAGNGISRSGGSPVANGSSTGSGSSGTSNGGGTSGTANPNGSTDANGSGTGTGDAGTDSGGDTGTTAGGGGSDTNAASRGGTGSGGGRPSTTIDLSKVVDEKGMVHTETHATDPSGAVTFVLKANTQALTRDRRPLTAIQVQPLTNHPILPDNVYLIGRAEELGPTGATFDPAITVTMGYDPAAIPTGLTPDDLELSYFDVTAGKWTSLPGAVDATNHTVSATTNHFTTFAVLTKPPVGVNWAVLGVIFVVEAALGAGAYFYLLRRRKRAQQYAEGDETDGFGAEEGGFDLDGVIVEEPAPAGIAGLLPRGRRGYTSVIEGEIVQRSESEPDPPNATVEPAENGATRRPAALIEGADPSHETGVEGAAGPAASPNGSAPHAVIALPAPDHGADSVNGADPSHQTGAGSVADTTARPQESPPAAPSNGADPKELP